MLMATRNPHFVETNHSELSLLVIVEHTPLHPHTGPGALKIDGLLPCNTIQ